MHHRVIILTQRHREHSGTEMGQLNFITGVVVNAGLRIHQKLGPGLLESVYEVVLARDLVRLGFRVAVIVEVKAARALDPVFERQLLTYLKILDLRLGLVMNFGMVTMKAGIHRIAN
jgi:hypothetical protein